MGEAQEMAKKKKTKKKESWVLPLAMGPSLVLNSSAINKRVYDQESKATRCLKMSSTSLSGNSSQNPIHISLLMCEDGDYTQKIDNKYWWGCAEKGVMYLVCRNEYWFSYYGKQNGSLLKTKNIC